jgi:hypothetical protein
VRRLRIRCAWCSASTTLVEQHMYDWCGASAEEALPTQRILSQDCQDPRRRSRTLASVVKSGEHGRPVTMGPQGTWVLTHARSLRTRSCECLGHRITALRLEAQPADDVSKDVSDSITRGPNVAQGLNNFLSTNFRSNINWIVVHEQHSNC